MATPHSFLQNCPHCGTTGALFTKVRHSSGEYAYQCQQRDCGQFVGTARPKRPRVTRGELYAQVNKRRQTRKNPIASASRDARDAARFAEAFHGRAPTDEYIAKVPRLPSALANIGKIHAIEYIAERDGEVHTYRHVFKAASRPYLAVTPDGKQVQMLGGAFEFTDRGFVDD